MHANCNNLRQKIRRQADEGLGLCKKLSRYYAETKQHNREGYSFTGAATTRVFSDKRLCANENFVCNMASEIRQQGLENRTENKRRMR